MTAHVASLVNLLPQKGVLLLLFGLVVIIYGMAKINSNTVLSAFLFGFVGNAVFFYGCAVCVGDPDRAFGLQSFAALPGAVWALSVFLAAVGVLVIGLVLADAVTNARTWHPDPVVDVPAPAPAAQPAQPAPVWSNLVVSRAFIGAEPTGPAHERRHGEVSWNELAAVLNSTSSRRGNAPAFPGGSHMPRNVRVEFLVGAAA